MVKLAASNRIAIFHEQMALGRQEHANRRCCEVNPNSPPNAAGKRGSERSAGFIPNPVSGASKVTKLMMRSPVKRPVKLAIADLLETYTIIPIRRNAMTNSPRRAIRFFREGLEPSLHNPRVAA
jgi:hypothetical protein